MKSLMSTPQTGTYLYLPQFWPRFSSLGPARLSFRSDVSSLHSAALFFTSLGLLAGTAAFSCELDEAALETLMSTPQNGHRPDWERHLSRLVRPCGTQLGFVRQVASRKRSISRSHSTQTWAIQHSLLAPSHHRQDLRGVVPTVVIP